MLIRGIEVELSEEQVRVFCLMAQGYVYREIAELLCVTEDGVQYRVSAVCDALGARTSREALSLLTDAGVLD